MNAVLTVFSLIGLLLVLVVGSSGPLLEVVEVGLIPIPPNLFAIAALVGITNTALINLIIASRVIYGMGREGVPP